MKNVNISELIGNTLLDIYDDVENIIFTTTDGEKYKMYHSQDCCESVTIDDICGDLNDLIGSPILIAEEISNNDFVDKFKASFNKRVDGDMIDSNGRFEPSSFTWTFYKLATRKGYVTIRWYGESNGCYSESVDFVKL